MQALTFNKSSWLLAAIFASLACLAYPQKSLAADTTVTCHSPVVVVWATGAGPLASAQVTIDCTGGSSSGFQYFAYRIKDNPNVANQIATLVGFYELAHPGAAITLSSDLSNLSGWEWGCGNANCRILDQVFGY